MMGGFSKTFSITGWRIGFVVAPPELAKTIGLVNDLHYVCAPTPLQIGVAHGIPRHRAGVLRGARRELPEAAEHVVTSLKKAGFVPYVPQGAYYLLANFAQLGGRTRARRRRSSSAAPGSPACPGPRSTSRPSATR